MSLRHRRVRTFVPRRIIIIAGPNGAGKTTFAREFLPREADCPEFINADLIAQGLSPFNPSLAERRAARLMIERIQDFVRAGRSFAFETTMSGMVYASRIRAWRRAGYHVTLIFLTLPNPELAITRVRMRVAQGGHHVPDEVVRRRFDAGMRNFERIYRANVDAWVIYDSSGSTPHVVETGGRPWEPTK